MAVGPQVSFILEPWASGAMPCLTCSLTNFVVPGMLSSLHSAKNSSPKMAFSGFLTPSSGLRPAYCCCFSALRNHFSTSNARFSGRSSSAGAQKIAGFSAQYLGNCVVD